MDLEAQVLHWQAVLRAARPNLMARYNALKSKVANRGVPPDDFLTELVMWGRSAEQELFEQNENPADIYAWIYPVLGPWRSLLHRRAVMIEVMRVLAGFESSWRWDCGSDVTRQAPDRADNMEAGAWQVSADSIAFGDDLRVLVLATAGSLNGWRFQSAMKARHTFAMEYIARLLRHTCRHNGPVLRHEIDRWLSRPAVQELEGLLGK